MSSFPGSPRVLPGAIVAVDPLSPLAQVVVFQYNPDEVVRRVSPRKPPSGGGSASDAQRIWGAPTESISMTLEFDATDGLAASDPVAVGAGVAPQIAALEMLLYPSSAAVAVNTGLLAAGTIEVLPPQGPLTVLAWGPGRVVPVTVESLSIREQAFGQALAPVRASVDVSLNTLTYDELSPTNPGFSLYVAHHVALEALARVAGFSGVVGASVELSVGG
ncbi:hypothetical protein GCM10027059_36670 [Myceligenerans halotolerans]